MAGFFHNADADPEQYIFGASPITTPPLQPDRNWLPWITEELQLERGYDPLSCASINTEKTGLRALAKRQYNDTRNWSERWLAWATGTREKGGNDPHFVAEFIRKNGIPLESDWPSDAPTFEEFYTTPPTILFEKAKKFLDEYSFQHDTVRGLDAMWDALQYSPLGASLRLLGNVDENGYYVSTPPDNHWTALVVGGEYGKYWMIADSAKPVFKKVQWDFKPQLVKRYALTKRTTATQTPTITELVLYVATLRWIRDWWLARQAPVAPVVPATPPKPVVAPIPSSQPQSARERLYNVAKAAIGDKLYKDAPPDRACAESLTRLLTKVIPGFPIFLSTAALYGALATHPKIARVTVPMKGDIAIAPTVGAKTGHCWVLGRVDAMSNTSATGRWEANYKNAELPAVAKKRGLQLTFFRLR